MSWDRRTAAAHRQFRHRLTPPDTTIERESKTNREQEGEGQGGGGRDNAQSTPAQRPGITGEVFAVKVESGDHLCAVVE